MKNRTLNETHPFLLFSALLALLLLCACDEVPKAVMAIRTSHNTTITIDGKTVYSSGGKLSMNGQPESGNAVQGTGPVQIEVRELPAFTAVELRTIAEVEIQAGEKHRCTVTAQENLLPLIGTEIAGETLRISPKESYSGSQPVKITIETPAIRKASLAGSGSISLPKVSEDTLVLEISGSGDIRATGKVGRLSATISGAGNIRAQDLESENGVVRILGAGNADVWVGKELEAEINGAGNIFYRGGETHVKSSVRGAGSVNRR
jgi:hypothetical protein